MGEVLVSGLAGLVTGFLGAPEIAVVPAGDVFAAGWPVAVTPGVALPDAGGRLAFGFATVP